MTRQMHNFLCLQEVRVLKEKCMADLNNLTQVLDHLDDEADGEKLTAPC